MWYATYYMLHDTFYCYMLLNTHYMLKLPKIQKIQKNAWEKKPESLNLSGFISNLVMAISHNQNHLICGTFDCGSRIHKIK